MRKIIVTVWLGALGGLLLLAADWPTQSGSPQRNGWARSEHILTRQNVGNLQLLYKFHADNQSRSLNSLTPPIVNGNLITYLGFKEMLVFGGSSDKVFSVDADLNQLLWEAHLGYQSTTLQPPVSTMVCPGGMTAPVIMPGSSSASMHFASGIRRSIIPARPPVVGPRDRPMDVIPPFDPRVTPLNATSVSHLAIFYAISSDGELHLLNSYTGEDLVTPLKFVPPNSKITSLNLWETTLYATTADDCNGNANALYSLDFLRPDRYVWSFTTNGSGFSGIGGTAIGRDGTVYVQVASGSNSVTGPLHDTVLALTSKDLRVKDYFTPSGKLDRKRNAEPAGITPTVFSWKGKELVTAADSKGRLYLLDTTMLGGADHHTPLSQTEPLVVGKKKKDWYGFHGTFTTWLDVDTETRWLYAPYWGALYRSQDETDGGHLLSFKIAETPTQPSLEPVWVSPGIRTPGSAVIANGMLFTLSSGETPSTYRKRDKHLDLQDWEAMTTPAVLYAFDAVTGKQLYSSGSIIKSYSRNPGLALANGRLYFGTRGNDIYCFGIPSTQPQLTVH